MRYIGHAYCFSFFVHLNMKLFFLCTSTTTTNTILNYAALRRFYVNNYDYIKQLNPNMPFMLRTCENAYPAVTTELEWTKTTLAKFMIQSGRFRNRNGTIAEDRVEAAKVFIATDWEKMGILRFSMKNFDPEKPFLDDDRPGWRDEPKVKDELAPYFALKNTMLEAETVMRNGPDDEYTRGENALLMCQRVDLWCAGPDEVERAVVHLYKLGRSLNEREVDMPSWISKFVPGSPDFEEI
jgi:hypothetical protein